MCVFDWLYRICSSTDAGLIVDQIQPLMNEWEFKYKFWRGISWGLGFGSVVLAAFAAIKFTSDEEWYWGRKARWAAALAAVCSGLTTLLSPGDRADRFNAAWVVLREAKFQYDLQRATNDNKENAMGDLITAWRRGETIINFDALKRYRPELLDSGIVKPASKKE